MQNQRIGKKRSNEDKGLQRPGARFIRLFGALFSCLQVFDHDEQALLFTKPARAACPYWPPIIEPFLLLSSTARMLVATVASELSFPCQSFLT